MKKFAIMEYGVGNISSVMKALKYVGFSADITNDTLELERADAIILPGVGAFPNAMKSLEVMGIDMLLKKQAFKKPILGICLGMQLLFDMSDEIEHTKGLSLISGEIKKIDTKLKLPHIGWNDLDIKKDSAITKGLDGAYVYFVHSFCAEVKNSEDILTTTTYGGAAITAMAHSGNVYGCQFHPEKSGETGLQILKNFGELLG